jgi:hypothetical protein
MSHFTGGRTRNSTAIVAFRSRRTAGGPETTLKTSLISDETGARIVFMSGKFGEHYRRPNAVSWQDPLPGDHPVVCRCACLMFANSLIGQITQTSGGNIVFELFIPILRVERKKPFAEFLEFVLRQSRDRLFQFLKRHVRILVYRHSWSHISSCRNCKSLVQTVCFPFPQPRWDRFPRRSPRVSRSVIGVQVRLIV